MKLVSVAVALMFTTALSAADELRIPLPEGTASRTLTASYLCAGAGPMTVEYLTADGISLALLPVEGRPLVFANVLAASGARYAAGAYVWWETGQTASLYDIRQGENAAPVMTCTKKD